MPMAPVRLCTKSHCGHVQPCPVHRYDARRRNDERRGTSAARGYDFRWQRWRKMILAEDPLCYYCKARGLIVPATTVDHMTPKARGGGDDRDNLCGACFTCNSAKRDKTAAEFLGLAPNG